MSYIVVGLAVGGTTSLSIATSVMGSNAAAETQKNAIKVRRQGARVRFAGLEDSSNLMKAAARESSQNAISEVLRVGMASETGVKEQIQAEASTSLARGEGLTSGNTAGREMVSLYVKGNKALQESKSKTSSYINQIVETQDKVTNDINNKLLQGYQELETILKNQGTSIDGTFRAINAGISGAKAGMSIMASASAAGTPASTGGANPN